LPTRSRQGEASFFLFVWQSGFLRVFIKFLGIGGFRVKLYEYQGKELVKGFGVYVPSGAVVESRDEALRVYNELGARRYAVKSQILAGGRGKAGGVRIVSSRDELTSAVNELLHKEIATYQTKGKKLRVNKLLIEEAKDIEKEFYFAITFDRISSKDVLMVSSEGGMDIEEIAKKKPDSILKLYIDPAIGLQDYQVREALFFLGIGKEEFGFAFELFFSLYRAYKGSYAILLEVNPLAMLKDGKLCVLDVKMDIDDNALFKVKEIADRYYNPEEHEPEEVEARKYGLSYVKLDGNIGCMVNGAGLAMATMDIIKYEGGEPANFLDIGGGATKETVEKGFEIILRDESVKVIFINIFGGIVRGERVAEGVVAAARNIGVKVPIVVRLEGTNKELGMRILSESGLNIHTASSLAEGARLAVKLSRGEVV
jgi:succinyl-CoA synthetase beta subunit